MQALVLGSGSRYRRELLERLQLPFSTVAPEVDESPRPGEEPVALARRLAADKALAVRHLLVEQSVNSRPIIIASDQVAALGANQLHKPGSTDNARRQLQAMSGCNLVFHTSLHLLDTATGSIHEELDQTTARMRSLSADEIERYIERDRPLDCAGSFKVESLGISLFDTVSSDDPTALVGLPLIGVCRGLRKLGVEIP